MSYFYSSCIQPFYNAFNAFFPIQHPVDANEAFTRIEQESIYTDTLDRRPMWNGESRRIISSISPSVEKAIAKFEKEGLNDKTALDLGCGKAALTIYMLQKGWRVIAVDYSQEALDRLRVIANTIDPTWITQGKLRLICEDITTYQLPDKVNLLVVNKVLPYIDPLKIRAIWDRLHSSLAEGGRLVGSFFTRSTMTGESKYSLVQRTLMNAWYTDISAVRALLNHKSLQKEVCEHDNFWFSNVRDIEFITRKLTTKTTRRGLFNLHLSSYFDAIAGLPSKSRASHAFPFLMDRLVELREAGKLMTFASGSMSLAQILFGFDASIATYTLAGSIGAWFFSHLATSRLEPKVKAYIDRVRQMDYREYHNVDDAKRVLRRDPVIQLVLNPPALPPEAIQSDWPLGAALRDAFQKGADISRIQFVAH